MGETHRYSTRREKKQLQAEGKAYVSPLFDYLAIALPRYSLNNESLYDANDTVSDRID